MTFGASKRRGVTSTTLSLLSIPVLLVVVGMVVYVGLLREAKTESQNGADAAALAAARELATDDLLTRNPRRAEERVRRARQAALTLGHENFAAGERLELDGNANNEPDGDLVFGRLDRPKGGTFRAVSRNLSDWVGDQINAVQVTPRRSPVRSPVGGGSDQELRTRAVAMIDHRVVGFRPNDDEPIPLMPIGLFTDHIGELPHGWDYQVRRVPRDELRFDYQAKRFGAGGDEIPEVTVMIGARGKAPTAKTDPAAVGDQTMAAAGGKAPGGVPALFLQLGVESFAETVGQARTGVTRSQLQQKYGSGLVLADDNTIAVPGSPECPEVGGEARRLIDDALEKLVASGEVRIWPLFSEVDEENSLVRVNGWMAARVASAGRTEGGGIQLTLQPAVLAHRAAVTEHRENPPAFWSNNRTMYRVRLAE